MELDLYLEAEYEERTDAGDLDLPVDDLAPSCTHRVMVPVNGTVICDDCGAQLYPDPALDSLFGSAEWFAALPDVDF